MPTAVRHRLHTNNWGYTVYLDRVFNHPSFSELARLRLF